MRLLLDHSAEMVAWTLARIPHAPLAGVGPAVGIGIATADKLVAGVVYHSYIPDYRSIEMSMASESPAWAKRGIIRALLHYPFEQLDCIRVSVAIPHTNKRALRFVKGIGFTHEGTLRRAFGRKHAVILSMLRPEFRHRHWRMEHGEEVGRLATRAA